MRTSKPASELVTIAYVHNGSVAARFTQALLSLAWWDMAKGRHFLRLLDQAGPYIADNRNVIVRAFLANDESDWLLFVDNDMRFPADVLERLLERADAHERPIVAGLYVTVMNDGDDTRVLPTWLVGGEQTEMCQLMEVPSGDLLVPLHGCGMGLTLIHRSVLEAIDEAYGEDPHTWFAHELRTFDPEIGPVRCGEDVSFCVRARELGFPICGATAVRAEHVNKTQVLTDRDVLPSLRIMAA